MKRLFGWIPPFVVGLTAAGTGHLALGLLLFDGDGMFRAITVVLGTEMAALALGLGSPPHSSDDPMRVLRRRWIVLLVAFFPAVGYAFAWTFTEGLGGTGLSQGLGLALLGGIPVYAAGLVLSAMSAAHTRRDGGTRVAGPAALGACTGVLVTGMVGMTLIGAPSLVLFSTTAIAAGALIEGWLLGEGEPPEPSVPEGTIP